MADLSNAEISVEGEYGECLVCGESFHWEQLTVMEEGSYCEDHVPVQSALQRHGERAVKERRDRLVSYFQLGSGVPDDEADMGHDIALERDTFGEAL